MRRHSAIRRQTMRRHNAASPTTMQLHQFGFGFRSFQPRPPPGALYIYIYLYTHIYVMYVCMHVCMYKCMYVRRYACVYVCLSVYLCACLCVFVSVCICVCMRACTYVYVFLSAAEDVMFVFTMVMASAEPQAHADPRHPARRGLRSVPEFVLQHSPVGSGECSS